MCFARILLASSMKGLFSASVKVFHSDPSLLEICKKKRNLVSNTNHGMGTLGTLGELEGNFRGGTCLRVSYLRVMHLWVFLCYLSPFHP